ncbi:MAG: redox-sensing transcriptional repressor Rex [Muribaculaceae bacterium]|nr:redox-sensing transcriptional repressor Rex [Muribaculaceae bacterium]
MNQIIHVILPEPTLRRLPWYLAFVDTIAGRGIKTVSSTQISKALNVDASQIAKDLSFLNIKGKTRIGYVVAELQEALSGFLDFKTSHKAFLFGAGSLGRALMADKGLANFGLNIVAAFDIDPEIIGDEISGVKIYSMDALPKLMDEHQAVIAVLTVPAQKAQDAADAAIEAGMKAIWNFTPYRVAVPDEIVLSSTSMYANLALIYNRLNAPSQEQTDCR